MTRVECHLFSGLLGVGAENGTKELERLIDDLPSEVDAHHHRHGRWRTVLKDILARWKSLGEAKIILIGHSYGAKRCQQIAKKLAAEDIEVAYIAGIDPTALYSWQPAMKIPDNVQWIDEFHATRGIPHNARKHDPSGRGGGMFVIPDELQKVHSLTKVPGSHVKCAASKITRSKVMEAIADLLS